MTTVAPPRRVREIAPSAPARRHSTLAHVDYVDAFVVDAPRAPERTAEEWVRAFFSAIPLGTRATLVSTWSALGLKLGSPRSQGLVLGWEVRRSDPDVALLGAESRIGMPAELLFERRRRSLLFATFVEHDNALARALWATIATGHRRVVRSLLERASWDRTDP